MSTIENVCNGLLDGGDVREILMSVSMSTRKSFVDASKIVLESGQGNVELAERVLSSLTCPSVDGKRIVSWNVDSLRSGIVDGFNASCKKPSRPIMPESPLSELLVRYDPDIICLQETKLQSDNERCFSHSGYHMYWNSSRGRKGYSGVAVWSKEEAIRVSTELLNAPDNLQEEGRILTVYFDGYVVVNTYTPNTLRAGTKPKRDWSFVADGEVRKQTYDKFVGDRQAWDMAMLEHLRELQREVGVVIWCGDMNVARSLRDIHNGDFSKEKLNRAIADNESDYRIQSLRKRLRDAEDWDRSGGGAGFRLEERDGLERILGDGFVDVYRSLRDDYGFTYFDRTKLGYFEADNGWRLDYFIVGANLLPCVRNIEVLKMLGVRSGKPPSDHVPLLIEF